MFFINIYIIHPLLQSATVFNKFFQKNFYEFYLSTVCWRVLTQYYMNFLATERLLWYNVLVKKGNIVTKKAKAVV